MPIRVGQDPRVERDEPLPDRMDDHRIEVDLADRRRAGKDAGAIAALVAAPSIPAVITPRQARRFRGSGVAAAASAVMASLSPPGQW